MTRRLAAILAADIAGYSRLMHEDESGDACALHRPDDRARSSRRSPPVRRRIVEKYGRRVPGGVRQRGPGRAVRLVVPGAHRRDHRRRCAGAPARISRRHPHRRMIVEERDIYGDGVNIAARLEALAEPGGVLVSEAVHENVRGRLPCGFEDLGAAAGQEHSSARSVFRILPRHSCARDRRRPARRPGHTRDHRAAVPEPQRRPRAGLFRGWYRRRHHHRACPVSHRCS